VIVLPESNESEVLRIAATLERASEHPLAAAILAGANDHQISPADIANFRSVTGKGVVGHVDGRSAALGNRALFAELKIPLGPLDERAKALEVEGQTAMFVAADEKTIGMITVADPIKPTTAQAISRLHREGIQIVMLTGDSRATAESVARKLKIDTVHAEVLPIEKGEIVNRLKAEGRVVAMAGDGVNDAPA